METNSQSNQLEAPNPEVLHAAGESAPETPSGSAAGAPATPKRRVTYRPSHKATFIGLAVVAVILAANAVVISFVMKNGLKTQDDSVKGVTINSAELDKLGVSRNAVGNADTELIVAPNSKFNGKVIMGSDVNIAGQLLINSAFKASEASLAKLQAGDTSVEKININGDATASGLNVRKDLQVAGAARIQGQLTVNQLTTINNNLNVAGNLAVGGSLTVRNFQVANLTIAGHLISSGAAPRVAYGGGAGPEGTVSINGNDTSGTIAVNAGVNARCGVLAQVTFVTKYDSVPHVVVTPVGRSLPGFYINRTSAGFSISCDGAMAPGGYAFDYIVAQ